MSTETTQPTEEIAPKAKEYLKELLVTLNKQWRIAMDRTDGEPVGDEKYLRMVMICDRFSAVWFLSKLIELDPAEAEKTTRELQGVLDDGGGVGEWAWDLLQGIGIDPESILAAEPATASKES